MLIKKAEFGQKISTQLFLQLKLSHFILTLTFVIFRNVVETFFYHLKTIKTQSAYIKYFPLSECFFHLFSQEEKHLL